MTRGAIGGARLAFARVVSEGAAPSRWAAVLHGVLGSGANWRSFAQKWVRRAPEWGVVLVDLRNHGGSLGLPPPHTVEACARDLAALGVPIERVLGHSFGGKVALEWARQRAGDLDDCVVVDSTPGAHPEALEARFGPLAVLDALRALGGPFARRPDFADALERGGLDGATARWLAMSVLREAPGGFAVALDLDAIEAMLADYFARDLWDVALAPPGRVAMRFVLGARGSVPEEDRARLRAAAARDPARVSCRELDAGHWVHVDAPEALLRELLGV